MIVETDLGEQMACDYIYIWISNVPYKIYEKNDNMVDKMIIEEYKSQHWGIISDKPVKTLIF